MELFKANRQWSTRPDDERFASIRELYDATLAYRRTAGEKLVPIQALRTEAAGEDVQLVGKQGIPARFSHWAFGQLCARVSAPATYLRELPPTLAAQNINYGLAHLTEDSPRQANLLFHNNGGLLLRAITSEQYERFWNHEVAERLLELEPLGWSPVGSFGKGPEDKRDADLYASDHDMFAFVCNQSNPIREAGSSDPLYRGIIVENSEVGSACLRFTWFLYRYRCCNHIIWGCSQVKEIALKHVGAIRERFSTFQLTLRRYAETAASETEGQIAQAKTKLIADTKEAVLDKLFGLRGLGLSRKALEESYSAVNRDQDGDPRSVWGFAQGISRHSQTLPYADKRTELDRAAGKLLEVAF